MILTFHLEHLHILNPCRDLDKCCGSHRAINLHFETRLLDAGGSIVMSSCVMAEWTSANWHQGAVGNGLRRQRFTERLNQMG